MLEIYGILMDTGNTMRYQWEKWDIIGSSDILPLHDATT